jgi:hypothetical protein
VEAEEEVLHQALLRTLRWQPVLLVQLDRATRCGDHEHMQRVMVEASLEVTATRESRCNGLRCTRAWVFFYQVGLGAPYVRFINAPVHGVSALYVACQRGDEVACRMLLEAGTSTR